VNPVNCVLEPPEGAVRHDNPPVPLCWPRDGKHRGGARHSLRTARHHHAEAGGHLAEYRPGRPEGAKKLLAEAGYPDGFETDLWAMPVQRPYNPDARRIAELMQSDLAKVGVKVKIVSYEWGEYRKRIQAGKHQMAMYGWTGDNGDPDNFFVPLAGCAAARIGGGNVAKWCNKEFDELVNKAATLPHQDERAKLYEQAQVIMHDQAPFYLVAHSVVYQPMSKAVIGYKMSPVGPRRFDQVDFK
jgi:dipeptide transport system substrate-binding protein